MTHGPLESRTTVALIAHDARKKDLVAFSLRHRATLSRYRLIATASTGQRLNQVLGHGVECKLSGPLGGDAQIAAEVASGLVGAVFFLVDPLSAVAHGADIQSLLRICNVHDVAVATNLSTAELLVRGLDGLRAKTGDGEERPSRSEFRAPSIRAGGVGIERLAGVLGAEGAMSVAGDTRGLLPCVAAASAEFASAAGCGEPGTNLGHEVLVPLRAALDSASSTRYCSRHA